MNHPTPAPTVGYLLTPGQRALGAALIGLPRHPFDENKPDYFATLLAKFVGVPDHALEAVAAELEECGLRQQPRYATLAAWVGSALAMDSALTTLLHQRGERSVATGARGQRIARAQLRPRG
jgi:hypothetical protein